MSSPPPRDLPNPGIGPRSPALQADSLPSEPPGKPKNGVDTGVGNLSLPNPGIEPGSPALQVDSLPAERPGKPGIPIRIYRKITYPQHVTIKLLGNKDKEKVLKAVRGEKRYVTISRRIILMMEAGTQ